MVNQLAPTYFEERDGDVKTWASDHASTFFAQWKPRAHRPGVPGGVSAAAGSASAAADASNTDATAKKKHLKLWSHTVTRRIIPACMHVFSADGSHMSLRRPKDIMSLVKAKLDLAEDIAYTTANDWLKKEQAVRKSRGMMCFRFCDIL